MTRLQSVMDRLNGEQRLAVDAIGNVVVLAGPGSGKTDTLTAKVARLMLDEVRPPHGVACITYGNDAAGELAARLRDLGIGRQRRLFLGTVHSFCLSRIERPYAALAGRPDWGSPRVLSERDANGVLAQAWGTVGAAGSPQHVGPTITRIRRALAIRESLDEFDEQEIAVAQEFDAILDREVTVDFEAMTLRAIRLLEVTPELAAMVAARYAWIAVDEYQDLGGPLHHLVRLLEAAGSRIFAVGDPDQCIYGFTGASPHYIQDLVEDPKFQKVQLRFNYRSGSALIAAAEASLGVARDYRPDPSRVDAGEVYLQPIDGGLAAQASWIVQRLVPSLLSQGVPAHEIAILYKGQGPLLNALVVESGSVTEEYLFEKDGRFPSSTLIRWLQRCATKAVGGEDADSYAELSYPYQTLMDSARRIEDRLDLQCRIVEALAPVDVSAPLSEWLTRVDEALDLQGLIAAAGDYPDDLESLRGMCAWPADAATVADFADRLRVKGRVVVTTCHSSKGRQFDVVVLPGLQKSLFPFERWDGGRYSATPRSLAEDRRLFYVGLTRARHQAHLLWSPTFTNNWGYQVTGRSMFVDEVEAKLTDMP